MFVDGNNMEITKEFKEKAKEAVDCGTRFAFIPGHLEIEGRPELNNFSLNIMFMSWTIRDGVEISGTALYEPDLTTFADGLCQKLSYYNIHSRDCLIEIEYDTESFRYEGRKVINGQNVGLAIGSDWKNFFVHLTMLGLTNGERCEFELV